MKRKNIKRPQKIYVMTSIRGTQPTTVVIDIL